MEEEIVPIVKVEIEKFEREKHAHPAIVDGHMVTYQAYKSADDKIMGAIMVDTEVDEWAYILTAIGESGRVAIDWKTDISDVNIAKEQMFESMDYNYHIACKNGYSIDAIARNRLRIELGILEENRQRQAEEDLQGQAKVIPIKKKQPSKFSKLFSSLVGSL